MFKCPKHLLILSHANDFPAGNYRGLFNDAFKGYQVTSCGKIPSLYSEKDNWQSLVNELINFVRRQLLLNWITKQNSQL